MNPKTFLISLCFGVATAGSAAAQTSDVAGAWTFISDVSTRNDGSVVAVDGPTEGYEGLLIYTPDGFVSANIMPKGRNWTSASATVTDLQETLFSASSSAYAGRYRIDTLARTITHTALVTMDPEFKGRELVRSYAIDGDILTLSGTWSYRGETLRFTVSWQRMR
jgi:hypothetical protein